VSSVRVRIKGYVGPKVEDFRLDFANLKADWPNLRLFWLVLFVVVDESKMVRYASRVFGHHARVAELADALDLGSSG
jgi:hypothetical protein